MRPQHITAENAARSCASPRIACTSMRPQHITAENGTPDRRATQSACHFNEAAAYHCGKHLAADFAVDAHATSMRPQHITAENGVRPPAARANAAHFNEAAAYHCGKLERFGSVLRAAAELQ